MTHRSIRSRLAITSLTVALLATAPASAMPTDPQGTTAKDPRQRDMHASTVQSPTDKADRTVQDARGEAAAAGSGQTKEKASRTVQDARGEAAAGGGTGSTGPASKPVPQGPPTWPMYPTPLPQPTEQQPVATDGGDDIGLDLPVALLILAGTLALGGGMAVAATKGRTHTRVVQ